MRHFGVSFFLLREKLYAENTWVANRGFTRSHNQELSWAPINSEFIRGNTIVNTEFFVYINKTIALISVTMNLL